MRLDDSALGEVLDYLETELTVTDALVATLHPLVAGAIAGASIDELQQAANKAVEEIWDDDLAAELRGALTQLSSEPGHVEGFDNAVAAALSELDRPLADNRVAYAFVWNAVASLMDRVQDNQDRIAELEDALAHTPPARHRALALGVVPAAIPAAWMDHEAAATAIEDALGDVAFDPSPRDADVRTARAKLYRALGTDERRAAIRESLAGLAHVCADDFPRSAAAVRELVAEPIPDDPANDELWVHLVAAYLEEQIDAAMAGALG